MKLRTFLPVAVSLFVFACTPDAPAPTEASNADLNATTPTGAPAASAPMPLNLHWFRNSAERQALSRQSYRLATMQIETQVAMRASDKPWGVVMDADETLLDNSQFQKESAEQNLPFAQERWTAWVNRKEAKGIPGAAAFLRRVHQLGGKIAIVTNRLAGAECPDTELNLRAEGIEYDAILCKTDTSNDKNLRFDAVEHGTAPSTIPAMEILMFVGDSIGDFPKLDQTAKADEAKLADFGTRFIMLANPMYGSWQGNPQN